MSSYVRVGALESMQRAKRPGFSKREHLNITGNVGAFLSLFVSTVALFDYWHITKEEKYLRSCLPSLSLTHMCTHTHTLHPQFHSALSCKPFFFFFFVIHLCDEDTAQLTSPMELNKGVIIQSSLAPKD